MVPFLLLAFLTLACAPATAGAEVRPEGFAQVVLAEGDAPLEARLLLHPDRTLDGVIRAAVRLTAGPGRFVAWRDPASGGTATRLRWRGAEAGPIEWPAPDALPPAVEGFVRHGYTGDVLLVSELVPDTGARRIEVEVEALVCATACVPVSFALGRDLSRVEPPDTAAAVRRLFARHAGARPSPPASVGRTVALRELGGDRLALTLGRCGSAAAPCPALAAPRFAPTSDRVRVLEAREAGGEIVVLLEREPSAPRRIEGVLSVSDADGRSHHLAIDVAPAGMQSADAILGVLLLAAFALGAAVNATPSRLADLLWMAGPRPPPRFVRHGLGLMASALGLAALALGLRFVAHAWIGSDAPLLVAFVAGVCTVGSLFLFAGGDEPRLAGQAPPDGSTFVGGLHALLRARACTVPLLAPALGFACFAGVEAVVVTALGLGLGLAATPPLLLRRAAWLAGAHGSAAEWRRALGFVPLAGAAWLLVRLARTAGAETLGWTLAGLLGVALVCWALGWIVAPRVRGAILTLGASVVLLVGIRVAALPAASPTAVAWTGERAASLREMHRPLVVVVGADWCLPCRWNEEAVLGSAPVRHALVRGGYTVLRADWTTRDEGVQRELARFGRAGVPLTLVYPAGAAEPVRLPDVLTAEAVLDAL